MSKAEIIKRLSWASDRYGNLLLRLMDYCGAMNLRDVTEEKANEFWSMSDADDTEGRNHNEQ